MTFASNLACPDNIFLTNSILALTAETPYRIPMISAMSDIISRRNFNMYDGQERYVTVGGDLTENTLGRLIESCNTECHDIRTAVKSNLMTLRTLCAKAVVCNQTSNNNYGEYDNILTLFPNIVNQALRQIERFAYYGYGNTVQLSGIEGLRGFIDLGTDISPATPIALNDYETICKFFIDGINAAKKGNIPTGNEFSNTDIDVHVSMDIVMQLSCPIVGTTTTNIWSQLTTTILGQNIGIGNLIITDQIENSVFFVNRRGIYGYYNILGAEIFGTQNDVCGMKTIYAIHAGTITFGKKTEMPVFYGNNVLDLP